MADLHTSGRALDYSLTPHALAEWERETIAAYRRYGELFQCPWNADTLEYYLVQYRVGALLNPNIAARAIVEYSIKQIQSVNH